MLIIILCVNTDLPGKQLERHRVGRERMRFEEEDEAENHEP
jgi:hypothetical protein